MSARDLAIAIGNRMPAGLVAAMRSDSRFAAVTRPVINRVIRPEPTMVSVRSGLAKDLRLYVDLRCEKYYWTGQHELHVQEALASSLRPGDTFWDIGAHIGFFTLLADRVVGDSGRVVAFEPMTQTRRRLERSLAANGVTTVDVRTAAVAGRSGRAVLHAHEASVMASLVEGRAGETGEDVEVTTLDELAAATPLPALIKIDAEGVELDVLKGGRELLTTHRPKVIVEFTTERDLETARGLYPIYAFRHLGQNHWLMDADETAGRRDGGTAGKVASASAPHPLDQFRGFAAPALKPGVRILDIGSGRKPALDPAERPTGCRYVGLDISAEELALAPEGSYDEVWTADITKRVPALEGRFDLVLSWQVLEHVKPIDAALANVRAYLAPEGRFVAMLSGSFACFAIANRVIPDRIGKALMQRLLQREPDTVFPARYDRCWYGALDRMLSAWRSSEIVPFYYGWVYFGFSPRLQRVYRAYETWAARAGHKNLATHYVIEARP